MTSDLDLPLLPSAEQIRRREFATVRRGYDPDQVREYLTQVASQVETLEKDARERHVEPPLAPAAPSPGEALAAQMAAPAKAPAAPADDVYERVAQRFAAAIEAADTEASRVLEEAKTDAARILDEARAEADTIRLDAQARAEEARHQGSETLANARKEADRILGTLSARRETLVTQMQDMQSRLLSVANDLEVAMDAREAALEERPGGADDVEVRRAEADEGGDAILDPRYEDLWTSSDGAVDIPDLAPIDLDFDDEARGGGKD
jgi:DivIVA domain-containing protein